MEDNLNCFLNGKQPLFSIKWKKISTLGSPHTDLSLAELSPSLFLKISIFLLLHPCCADYILILHLDFVWFILFLYAQCVADFKQRKIMKYIFKGFVNKGFISRIKEFRLTDPVHRIIPLNLPPNGWERQVWCLWRRSGRGGRRWRRWRLRGARLGEDQHPKRKNWSKRLAFAVTELIVHY